jgi:hypothetical protein
VKSVVAENSIDLRTLIGRQLLVMYVKSLASSGTSLQFRVWGDGYSLNPASFIFEKNE